MAKPEETGTGDHDGDETDAQELRNQLDWKDYIALAIAALETIMLPVVILIVVLFVLLLIAR